MPKKKPIVEPLSLDLSPLKKKDSKKEKIGVINPFNKNRKMVSVRLRVEMINAIYDLIKKLKKKTHTNYSQSAIIEMALAHAAKAPIEELLKGYGETFWLDKL